MVMALFLYIAVAKADDELPPLVEAPPVSSSSSHSTHRSIETLVVVLAVITLVAVVAGVFARICGGRHFSGNGEDDIEGWVEKKCRSCIDAGVPAPQTADESKPPTAAAKV